MPRRPNGRYETRPSLQITERRPFMKKAHLILSITSIPERIELFLSNLDWLVNQSVQPKATVIWLGAEYFSHFQRQQLSANFSLPPEVEIRYRPDLGPQTKLLYALREFNHFPIITADDDIRYPPLWLEELYNSYQSAPKNIHCFRAHGMRMEENHRLAPYFKWDWQSPNFRGPSPLLFPTGTSGVIYPIKALSKHVFDLKVMQMLCQTADDIWFKAMSLLNRTLVQKVHPDSQEFPQIDGSEQEVALWKINIMQNDVQLKNVFDHYSLYTCLRQMNK